MSEESLEGPASSPPLDPAQLEYLRQRLQSEQDVVLGVLAGTVAALAGAAGWAGFTLATGYRVGFMAVGVGLLVGFAVRTAGRGVTAAFGWVSAALSLLGCLLGNLLVMTAIVARSEGVPFFSVASELTPDLIRSLMVASFSPTNLVFYGIAVYEGYQLAFRRLTPAELERMLSGGAAVP